MICQEDGLRIALSEGSMNEALAKALIAHELDKKRKTMTYQAEFPETEKCNKCGRVMPLMVLIMDEKGKIKDERPESVKVWPHDCVALAVYLCTEDGEAKVQWNQG